MVTLLEKIIEFLATAIVSLLITLGFITVPEHTESRVDFENNMVTTHTSSSTAEKIITETTPDRGNENSVLSADTETENNSPPPLKEEEVRVEVVPIITQSPNSSTDLVQTVKTTEEKNTPTETLLSENTLPTFETVDLQDVNTRARSALVNIFCRSDGSGNTQSIVGSGIIIDPRGIILTNAHVAQFLLLKDAPQKNALDCTIRMHDPATPLYRADLLYISPSWIEENATMLTNERPTGTGQFDFAFLYITEHVNQSQTLPSSFPFLTPNTTHELTLEQQVLVAGYPAGFLSGSDIERNLYSASSYVTVEELFTFSETTIDLVSLSGSIVAQRGSSGGAVVSINKQQVEGIITTVADAPETKDRRLRAITISHIDDTLFKEAQIRIPFLLGSNLKETAQSFEELVGGTLRKKLVDVLYPQQ